MDVLRDLEKGWEELKHKNCLEANVKVYYKLGENGKIQTVLEMNLPFNIIDLSALFFEFDLFPVWMEQQPD